MRAARIALAFACFEALVLVSARSGADDARALFDEGVAMMQAGRFAEAIPKLEAAQRIDPGTGTEYDLAVCYFQTGRLASAWQHFQNVERDARAGGKTHREEVARARLEEISARVPKLRIVMADADDTLVLLDGASITPDDAGMVRLDPGPHRIDASAVGRETWTVTVQAPAERQTMEVAVPRLVAIPAVAPAPKMEPAPALFLPPPRPIERSGARTLAWVLGGVGVVGLGAAAVTGLVLLGEKSTADDHCLPRCDASGRGAVASMKTLLPINAIAWVAGLGGLGTGTFLWFTSNGVAARVSWR